MRRSKVLEREEHSVSESRSTEKAPAGRVVLGLSSYAHLCNLHSTIEGERYGTDPKLFSKPEGQRHEHPPGKDALRKERPVPFVADFGK